MLQDRNFDVLCTVSNDVDTVSVLLLSCLLMNVWINSSREGLFFHSFARFFSNNIL